MPIIGESGQYTGLYSLTIKDTLGNQRNRFSDWHLVPEGPPLFNPPEVKTRIVENPGGDGIIDMSQAVTGFPLYGQRTGSWSFFVLHGWYDWEWLYSDILNFLHGKNVIVIPSTDSLWYYNGRVTVNQPTSDQGRYKIQFDYDLDPYKLNINDSINLDWEWDTFNFDTDIILSTAMKNISFSGSRILTFKGADIGRRPVTPTWKIESGSCSKLTLYNKELWGDVPVVKEGLNEVKGYHYMDMILSGFNEKNELKIVMEGTGTMSIVYRPGKL